MMQVLSTLRVCRVGPLGEAGRASRKHACGPQPGIVWVPAVGSCLPALGGLSSRASEGLQETTARPHRE